MSQILQHINAVWEHCTVLVYGTKQKPSRTTTCQQYSVWQMLFCRWFTPQELRVPDMDAAAAAAAAAVSSQQMHAQAGGGSSPAGSISSNSSSLAHYTNPLIGTAIASAPAAGKEDACYIATACNSGDLGSPIAESSPCQQPHIQMPATAHPNALGYQTLDRSVSSSSFGMSNNYSCSWEWMPLASSAAGAHALHGHQTAQMPWESSSALLRADSQSSMQLQLTQQLLQLSAQQQQQQYSLLLGCSADTAAAAALQWLGLQTDQPAAAAAAAGYPDPGRSIGDSERLLLLLEATSRQLHSQLSLDSNAVISVPAALGAAVMQVGSYSSSMDYDNSMLTSQALLAGQATLAAASSAQPPHMHMLSNSTMPSAFNIADAGGGWRPAQCCWHA
jgi:hypothetical protein